MAGWVRDLQCELEDPSLHPQSPQKVNICESVVPVHLWRDGREKQETRGTVRSIHPGVPYTVANKGNSEACHLGLCSGWSMGLGN